MVSETSNLSLLITARDGIDFLYPPNYLIRKDPPQCCGSTKSTDTTRENEGEDHNRRSED
jgi:hypothetical protein